jgi:hypothetical protein
MFINLAESCRIIHQRIWMLLNTLERINRGVFNFYSHLKIVGEETTANGSLMLEYGFDWHILFGRVFVLGIRK